MQQNRYCIKILAANFLEIKFVGEMLDVNSFKDIFGRPFDGNSPFVGPRKNIETTNTNLWKKKLSRIEIYLTEMVLKDKLLKHGYELSGITLTKQEFCEMHSLVDQIIIDQIKKNKS